MGGDGGVSFGAGTGQDVALRTMLVPALFSLWASFPHCVLLSLMWTAVLSLPSAVTPGLPKA